MHSESRASPPADSASKGAFGIAELPLENKDCSDLFESGDHHIFSLRRQNEDLNAKLASLMCDLQPEEIEYKKRCQDLEMQLAKLNRLLDLERKEMAAKEMQVLHSITELKTKSQEPASLQVGDLSHSQVSQLKVLNEGLSNKVGEFKRRLQNLQAEYDLKVGEADQLQKQLAVEKELALALVGDRQTATALEYRVRNLEMKAANLEQENQGLSSQLLQKEFTDKEWQLQHSARTEELLEMRQRNGWLQDHNTSLEKHIKDKDAKLEQLDSVLNELQSEIVTKGSIATKFMDVKIAELTTEFSQLQQSNRSLQEELRLAESKLAEAKDNVVTLHRARTEDQNRARDLERQLSLVTETYNQSESQKAALIQESRALMQQLEDLREHATKGLFQMQQGQQETKENREAVLQYQSMSQELESLRRQMADQAQLEQQYQHKNQVLIDLRTLNCNLEAAVEKLSCQKKSLSQDLQSIGDQLCSAEAQCTANRSQIDELKSRLSQKESQLTCLEEKHLASKLQLGKERQMWTTRCHDLTQAKEQMLIDLQQLRHQVRELDSDLVSASEDNVKLHDQNSRLKEELTALISSVQSLKESNLMLQDTIKQLADQLSDYDATIRRLNSVMQDTRDALDSKSQEHAVTVQQLEQLKKLAQLLPNGAAGHGKKA